MTSLVCDKCGKKYKKNKSFYLKHIEKCDKNKIMTLEEKCIENTISKPNKKELGQFYTTNYDYILQNFSIPPNEKNIIEPFAGACHLLKFLDKSIKYDIESYDIEPASDMVTERDTLNNPPSYKNKFILTNPPYLARNKTKSKKLFDKYKTNDLYKCFIKQIISDPSNGGILIIPLNF